MRDIILATDLAHHLRILNDIENMVTGNIIFKFFVVPVSFFNYGKL